MGFKPVVQVKVGSEPLVNLGDTDHIVLYPRGLNPAEPILSGILVWGDAPVVLVTQKRFQELLETEREVKGEALRRP